MADSGKIPPDAVFLVPRDAQTFKWYTGQRDVVNWKDVPQDAKTLLEWWRRIQDIYATGLPEGPRWHEPLAEVGADRLATIGRDVPCRLYHHRADRSAAEAAGGL